MANGLKANPKIDRWGISIRSMRKALIKISDKEKKKELSRIIKNRIAMILFLALFMFGTFLNWLF